MFKLFQFKNANKKLNIEYDSLRELLKAELANQGYEATLEQMQAITDEEMKHFQWAKNGYEMYYFNDGISEGGVNNNWIYLGVISDIGARHKFNRTEPKVEHDIHGRPELLSPRKSNLEQVKASEKAIEIKQIENEKSQQRRFRMGNSFD